MNEKTQKVIAATLSRLSEPSTYAGFAGFFAAIQAHAPLSQIAIAALSAVAVFMPEQK
jgi:hypothetical protein